SSTNQFFIFTPKNVGSCDSSNSCAFTTFCAYHGYASGGLIYANQPYAAIANCDGGQRPNSDDADLTINVTSHEHREAINDCQLNAWYDAAGYEGSDKCAWQFGSMLGGTAGHQYNQLINGNPYFLQMEYSNDGHACLLNYSGGGGSTSPSISSFSPTSGPVG